MLRIDACRGEAEMVDRFGRTELPLVDLVRDAMRPSLSPLVGVEPDVEQAVSVGMYGALPQPAGVSSEEFRLEAFFIRE